MKSKSQKYAYELVASDIINRIGKGEWALGSRIPAVESLVSQYPYSHMTVFKALKHLESMGYIEMRRGSGIYVAKTGRQFNIAMLFCDDILRPQRTPFTSLVMEAGKRYFQKKDATFEVFITDSQKKELTCREFLTALKNRSIDGFFTMAAEKQLAPLLSAPFWEKHHVPFVAVADKDQYPCTVYMGVDQEVEMAFKYMRARNIKKLTVIGYDPIHNKMLEAMASKYGLTLSLHPFTLEIGPSDFPEEKYEIFGFVTANKILSSGKLPEAIFVLDDIIAKGVAMELFKLGVKIPEDLLFMTQYNKGSGVFYPVPTVKIEFDPDKIFQAAGDMLWQSLNKGKPCIGSTCILPKLCAIETVGSIYGEMAMHLSKPRYMPQNAAI